MPPSRTYSIGGNNEQQHNMSSHDQSPYTHHDSSSRMVVSPPPHYASPAPPEPPSPVAFSHNQSSAAEFMHYPRTSSRISRDVSPERYTDRSPSPPPPPPPPHRTSRNRYLEGNSHSPVRRSPVGHSVAMDELRTDPQDARAFIDTEYRHGGHDERDAQYNQQYGRLHQDQYQLDSSPVSSPYLQRPVSHLPERSSYGSNIPLAAGAATPGSMTPGGTPRAYSSRFSGRSIPLEDYPTSQAFHMTSYGYSDSPYHTSSHKFDPTVSDASINPNAIADDGDDGFMSSPRMKSAIPTQRQRSPGRPGGTAATTAAAAASTGGRVLGGLFGRQGAKGPSASGTYDPVDETAEKDAWLSREKEQRKRRGLIVGIGIGLIIVLAIVAGIVGGVLGTHTSKSGSGNTNNANDDTQQNGDLDLNSAEIQALMNNPNLHKVFPGIDYTPWGVQYPLCNTYPPSQNNVTRDMAVLSQLTNTIRLYGTDCNQTEMVLHAIDRLKLTNVKIWLGVWIDTNTTTTERQIAKMYNILEEVKDRSIFKGAIVGNEALYRAGEDKAQSKQELIQILQDVRANFTSLGYDLPIATSDLGDNWDGDLVAVVDYVMSNIHPFFAGVSAEEAASWTYDFWQTHDVVLTASTPNVKQIISETGWPSDGGTDCGGTNGDCASGQSGATASVDNMNTFMEGWVCQALANGTDYFWFEAFDEPWKVQYNTPGKEWEDKWGLMDSARKLKSGIKIPDCGGTTVS